MLLFPESEPYCLMSNSLETTASIENPAPWLRRFTKLVVLATLVLIFLGGQVKSNEAGLAVPDWPTTYGENMFLFHPSNWIGGIFHEHVHRLVASSVGFLSIVLAVWLAIRERRRWVKILGFTALGAVIVQGLLGGITVLLLLPAWVSVSHAVLAQTFLLLLIVIAYSQSRERAGRNSAQDSNARNPVAVWAIALAAAVYLQLIVGALMRHTESGLAIPDFPTTAGRVLPWFNAASLEWINGWRFDYSMESGNALDPVTMGQVLIHFGHRVGAFGVFVLAMATTAVAYRHRETERASWQTVWKIDLLIALQICLGAVTIWTQKVPVVTSLHVATGAAVLGFSMLFVLRAHPLRLRRRPQALVDGELTPIST